MKRNLKILTEENRRQIKNWVALSAIGKRTNCPFSSYSHCLLCCAIFPSLKFNGCCCPCTVFGLKYTTKVAKSIIK